MASGSSSQEEVEAKVRVHPAVTEAARSSHATGSTASASAWFGDANPDLALHSSRFLRPSRHVRNLFGVHRRRSEKLCSLHSNTIPRSHSLRRNLSRTRAWAAATTPCCVYSSESLLSRQAPTSTCLNPGSSVTTSVARTSLSSRTQLWLCFGLCSWAC